MRQTFKFLGSDNFVWDDDFLAELMLSLRCVELILCFRGVELKLSFRWVEVVLSLRVIERLRSLGREAVLGNRGEVFSVGDSGGFCSWMEANELIDNRLGDLNDFFDCLTLKFFRSLRLFGELACLVIDWHSSTISANFLQNYISLKSYYYHCNIILVFVDNHLIMLHKILFWKYIVMILWLWNKMVLHLVKGISATSSWW